MNSAAPATSLHHSTQLALTPQLQQSLRLLQMSALELEAEVSHMLDTNPFLELAEPHSEHHDSSDDNGNSEHNSDDSHSSSEHDSDEHAPLTPRDEIPSTDSALLEHLHHTLAQASADHDYDHEHGPPLEIADHPPDTPPAPNANSTTGAAAADSDTLANLNPAPQSLAEHLHAQARLLRLNELDAAALHHLIDNLDERGYLNDSLDDLIAHLLRQPHSNHDGNGHDHDDNNNSDGDSDDNTPIATLRQHFRLALQLLHTLEPAGVGARNLAECLRLQLLPLLQHQPPLPAPTHTPRAAAQPPTPSAQGAAICHAHCTPAQPPGPLAQPDAAQQQHHGSTHPTPAPASDGHPPTARAAAPSPPPSASACATPLSTPAAIAWQLCQPATLAALGRRNTQQQIRFVEQTLTPPPAPTHIAAALALLARLEPNPGRPFAHSDTTAIVPDLIVSAPARGGRATSQPRTAAPYNVHINPDVVPELRIHALYARALRQHASGHGHEALHQRLQEARWFIRNVQQRFDTLLRVAQAIVQHQRSFFTHGEIALRPLLLRDIAQELNLHESTISRVTTAKYIATPRGLYELKYFFSSGLDTDSGTPTSSTAVRALVRQLIAAEDPRAPLSDSALAQRLLAQGITCARRTVAKYREELHIPPASQRQTQNPT